MKETFPTDNSTYDGRTGKILHSCLPLSHITFTKNANIVCVAYQEAWARPGASGGWRDGRPRHCERGGASPSGKFCTECCSYLPSLPFAGLIVFALTVFTYLCNVMILFVFFY